MCAGIHAPFCALLLALEGPGQPLGRQANPVVVLDIGSKAEAECSLKRSVAEAQPVEVG